MGENQRRPQGNPGRSKPTWFGRSASLVAWLVFSLALSILVDWIGLTWVWHEEGLSRGRRVFATELRYLGPPSNGQAGSSAREFALSLSNSGHEWLCRRTGLSHQATRFQNQTGSGQLVPVARRVGVYLQSAEQSVRQFGLRIAALILSTPILGLFVLIGIVEGLVARDLRRWGGGRESSYVFHHAKRSVAPLLLVPAVIYLMMPLPTDITLIITPAAVALGLLTFLTIRSFKKYL